MMSTLNRVKISPHFYLSEFECKGKTCCGYSVKVHPDLIEALEWIRAYVLVELCGCVPFKGLLITSGYRCPQHNRDVGGTFSSLDPLDPNNSFHCRGMAADIAIPGLKQRRLAHIARKAAGRGHPWFRVGYYRNNEGNEVVHIDVAQRSGLPQFFGDLWDEEEKTERAGDR